MTLAEAPGQLSAFAAMAWAWAVAFVPRLGAAALLLAIGVVVARWTARLVRSVAGRAIPADTTIEPILATAARYTVLILFLVAALGQLGVQTASLLAVLGAAGLAIGLALQGTLQNIAAGIMLIYLRPFRVGDYIETPAVAGTIKEMGLFVTHLETGDGLFYFVPNGALWNVPLRNHTRNARRLMTITFSSSYEADPAEVRRVLLEMAASDTRVLKDPPPIISVDSYTENRVIYAFRAWAPTDVFWSTQRAMIEEAKQRLQQAGVKIPM
jgi:small conductance mechanosensitive channel